MKRHTLFFLILFFCLQTSISKSYIIYDTYLQTNITIPGYRTFDYVFWLHPGQANQELQTLFTQKTLDTLRMVIPEGSVVIDIGAHVGDTSVAYSLVVGEQGTVIAFEPNPSCFDILQMNAKYNANIIPVNAAITETTDTYTFYYTDPGLCNGAYAEMLSAHPYTVPVQVKGVNLIEWLQEYTPELIPKIKFIKIDTEGYDRYIVKNIKDFLLQYRPILQCELFVYLNPEERESFFNILNELNYTIVLAAYEGIIETSAIRERTLFSYSDFVLAPIPTGSLDILCIPTEQFEYFK